MPYSFPPDLQEQVAAMLATGQYASEDEVLRDAVEALRWEQEERAAVLAAVADVDAGEAGIPLNEAFDRVRKQHRPSADGG